MGKALAALQKYKKEKTKKVRVYLEDIKVKPADGAARLLSSALFDIVQH